MESIFTMNHKQLVEQLTSLQAEMANYKSEVSTLRSRVEAYENIESEASLTAIASAPTSRRRMLKRFVAGVAGIGAMGLVSGVAATHSVLAETVADNAIEATSGSGGYALLASSAFAPIRMVPTGSTGAPSAGAHQAGELYVDSAGSLFYCAVAGSPGTWRRLAGSSTAGALQLLPSPARVVDTLNAGGAGGFNGSITNTTKTFTIAGVGGIPANAVSVMGNITAFAPNFASGGSFPGTGSVLVFPTATDGASGPNASTLAFSAPQTLIANNFTSGLVNGKLGVFVYQSARVAIDIVGYYL
jgi:hypothetical protein